MTGRVAEGGRSQITKQRLEEAGWMAGWNVEGDRLGGKGR